ncbi:MAG: nicotinate phosphoribosyltransferase [Desulfobacteraceae bacterium]
MRHTATAEEIRKGLVTDVYFQRTEEVLRAKGLNPWVRAEFTCKGLPGGWPWAVFAGVEEASDLLLELPLEVRALPEGTVFNPYVPVMDIQGRYLDFARYETTFLGLLCQASGVATMAARCKKTADGRVVNSFGARRLHPAVAPMVERNAYIGGCDGVALTAGARLVGQEPVGTMPHALILIIGDTVEATQAFDRVIAPEIKRVSLIDTFNDEKIEALRVAEALGQRLFAVRLDTPGSRRGDFFRLVEEVRWELDLRGYRHVKIFLSGGLDEYQIAKYNPVADAYGVGTAISDAPVVDFSMDIVEIEGRAVAKRGKMSGSKRVSRCPVCMDLLVTPEGGEPPGHHCGMEREELLTPLISRERILRPLPSADQIRAYVLEQMEKIDLQL